MRRYGIVGGSKSWRVGFGVSNTQVRPSIFSCYPCCVYGISSQQTSTDQDTWVEEAELTESGQNIDALLPVCRWAGKTLLSFPGPLAWASLSLHCWGSECLLKNNVILPVSSGQSRCSASQALALICIVIAEVWCPLFCWRWVLCTESLCWTESKTLKREPCPVCLMCAPGQWTISLSLLLAFLELTPFSQGRFIN